MAPSAAVRPSLSQATLLNRSTLIKILPGIDVGAGQTCMYFSSLSAKGKESKLPELQDFNQLYQTPWQGGWETPGVPCLSQTHEGNASTQWDWISGH